jgi:hypothetical protein
VPALLEVRQRHGHPQYVADHQHDGGDVPHVHTSLGVAAGNYIDRATASGPTLVEALDAFMTLGHTAGPRDERSDRPTSPKG